MVSCWWQLLWCVFSAASPHSFLPPSSDMQCTALLKVYSAAQLPFSDHTGCTPTCPARRYLSLIFAGVVFVDLSLRTLPLYSLAVQMGSEFKHRERCRPDYAIKTLFCTTASVFVQQPCREALGPRCPSHIPPSCLHLQTCCRGACVRSCWSSLST